MKNWLHALRILKKIKSYSLDNTLLEVFPSKFVKLFFVLIPVSRHTKYLDGNKRGEALKLALEELGPVFIKFGQALSTRPDLLPHDIATELTSLQDNVPPFGAEKAQEILHETYGDDIENIFSDIDYEPVASASVAQVHYAKLKKENTDVIIKLLRPGIKNIIDKDISLLYLFAKSFERIWSEGARLKLTEVVFEYDKTIHHELDLIREAANASQLRANFEGSDIVYVPKVYFDYTEVNSMVMERIKGISIRDIDTIKSSGMDIKKLAYDGVEIFFTQVFRDGFFHADMHPGNIFICNEAPNKGQYRAIDFGIMGTLTDEDKHYLAVNFLAFFNRDYRAVAQAHIDSGWVPSTTRVDEFESAVRSVCEPIFAKPMSEISFGKVVMRLFQVARQFEMPVQPQLVLLQKTMLNIEGLGRQLYPELDLWESAKPILEDWMSTQKGSKALFKTIKNESLEWAPQLPKIPNLIYAFLNNNQNQIEQNKYLELQLQKVNKAQARNNSLVLFLLVVIAILLLYILP